MMVMGLSVVTTDAPTSGWSGKAQACNHTAAIPEINPVLEKKSRKDFRKNDFPSGCCLEIGHIGRLP
jgi:hypothetical protein